MRRTTMLLALASLIAASPTSAQDGSDDDTICVGGTQWRATEEDRRAIETIAVPVEYRRLYDWTRPCQRLGFDRAALINWHLSFGSERSLLAAFAWLEPFVASPNPTPERYARELPRLWADALRTISAARIPAENGPEQNRRVARLRRAPAVALAVASIETNRDFLFLAEQYVLAAEVYDSPDLLARGGTYLDALRVSLAVMFPEAMRDTGSFQADPYGILNPDDRAADTIQDIAIRAAILRARLSRRAEDILAADALVGRSRRPVYEAAARNARDRSGDYCDLEPSLDEPERQALQQACDAGIDLKRRTRTYWRNRAHLDLIKGADRIRYGEIRADRSDAMWNAEWLLRYDRIHDVTSPSLRFRPENRELFLLLIALADHHLRLSRLDRSGDFSPESHFRQALDALVQAERVVPPFEAPARFRQVAEQFLRVWDAPPQPHEEWARASVENIRFAAYLRATLAALDRERQGGA